MSQFKYELYQRVMVPGPTYRQGVITEVHRVAGTEAKYNVSYLKTMDVDGKLIVGTNTMIIGETDLIAAQPAETVTRAEAAHPTDAAEARAHDVFKHEMAALRDTIAKQEAQIGRLRAARVRKRKR